MFGISPSNNHSGLVQFAHISISFILAFIVSLDDIIITVKSRVNVTKNHFEGEWKSEIFDMHDTKEEKIIKSDIWDVEITDNKMSGKIKRILPEDDMTRKWIFTGYLVNDEMHVAFTQTVQTGRSRGCALLKKSSNQDSVFSDKYFKFNDNRTLEEAKIKLIMIKN
ncbi:MAG: hypothetical protein FWC97_04045 [Treponema sp.]|nr:hypothetical protein [Treponema sp.]